MFLNFTNPYVMSNVNTLHYGCSHLEQDNTLIYLDEHRIYRYIPYYTIIVSVAKKTSDFRNKMYYIFGEYMQGSRFKSNSTNHVDDIIADIKVCKLYV